MFAAHFASIVQSKYLSTVHQHLYHLRFVAVISGVAIMLVSPEWARIWWVRSSNDTGLLHHPATSVPGISSTFRSTSCKVFAYLQSIVLAIMVYRFCHMCCSGMGSTSYKAMQVLSLRKLEQYLSGCMLVTIIFSWHLTAKVFFHFFLTYRLLMLC